MKDKLYGEFNWKKYLLTSDLQEIHLVLNAKEGSYLCLESKIYPICSQQGVLEIQTDQLRCFFSQYLNFKNLWNSVYTYILVIKLNEFEENFAIIGKYYLYKS